MGEGKEKGLLVGEETEEKGLEKTSYGKIDSLKVTCNLCDWRHSQETHTKMNENSFYVYYMGEEEDNKHIQKFCKKKKIRVC